MGLSSGLGSSTTSSSSAFSTSDGVSSGMDLALGGGPGARRFLREAAEEEAVELSDVVDVVEMADTFDGVAAVLASAADGLCSDAGRARTLSIESTHCIIRTRNFLFHDAPLSRADLARRGLLRARRRRRPSLRLGLLGDDFDWRRRRRRRHRALAPRLALQRPAAQATLASALQIHKLLLRCTMET